MEDKQTTTNFGNIPEPAADNELSHELSRLQRCVDRQLRRCIEKHVDQSGIYRGQHMLLMWLGHNPGATQAQLAKARDISPAATTNALQKLEKDGYILREADEEDCRINHVQVTDKGQKVIEQSLQTFQKIDEEMYQGFNEEELLQLKSFYERILHNLKIKVEEEE